MILIIFGSVVLLYHLMKGGYHLIKGVIGLVAPFLSKRSRIKKTPEYKAFEKYIEMNVLN